jgi:RNA polymerase sigma-70 factor (sigma-E family)
MGQLMSEGTRTAGPTPDEAGFRSWLALRAPTLRRKAVMLCGDWHRADDLVQDTLVAMYAGWPRIARGSNVDAYANRVLVSRFIDDRRRPWRRERSVETVPDAEDAGASRAFDDVEGPDALLAAALAALPVGQRAVVVLRFTDDLTVDEIAHVMDLPAGTVKSRLSRGTESLRARLERDGHPRTLARAGTAPERRPDPIEEIS